VRLLEKIIRDQAWGNKTGRTVMYNWPAVKDCSRELTLRGNNGGADRVFRVEAKDGAALVLRTV
jgi:hypothetical protein